MFTFDLFSGLRGKMEVYQKHTYENEKIKISFISYDDVGQEHLIINKMETLLTLDEIKNQLKNSNIKAKLYKNKTFETVHEDYFYLIENVIKFIYIRYQYEVTISINSSVYIVNFSRENLWKLLARFNRQNELLTEHDINCGDLYCLCDEDQELFYTQSKEDMKKSLYRYFLTSFPGNLEEFKDYEEEHNEYFKEIIERCDILMNFEKCEFCFFSDFFTIVRKRDKDSLRFDDYFNKNYNEDTKEYIDNKF